MKRYRPAQTRPVLRIPADTPGFDLYFFVPEGMDVKEAQNRAADTVDRYHANDGFVSDISAHLVTQGFVPVEFIDSPKQW